MTYIIAEVGGNHDGNLETALELIHEAAQCGCDAVKFQSYKSDSLVHPLEKSLPQAKKAGYDLQIERFRDLEFTYDEWDIIVQVCEEEEIDFLTTPFDLESLSYFKDKMKYIKISSGDLTYHRLLRAVAETVKPVILSTGMATYPEINEASLFFNPDRLTVCHCVSIYPCPDSEANLHALSTLKSIYRSVGYSDHTEGLTACLAASYVGLDVIEKHFTLEHKNYGDHPLSLVPYEMKELVFHVKRINEMLGDIKPAYNEPRKTMRRSAYAKHNIELGQIITENDVIELRPQKGRRADKVIGTRATKNYKRLDLIG